MYNLKTFNQSIQVLFTDIDDTLTNEGILTQEAYSALWRLKEHGIDVIPVTGRPAGWCEMIARLWPVRAVIGENGAFYFQYENKTMHRFFAIPEKTRNENQIQLEVIRREILTEVPGSQVASDQFCRLFDLAIDFCEDVPPLDKQDVQKIQNIFHKHGATAKVSSIHVNGWFGDYDKISMIKILSEKIYNWSPEKELKKLAAFAGDSPNDEPAFAFFPNSFAVKNISHFWDQIKEKPKYVAEREGGYGFSDIVDQIIAVQKKI